MPEYLDSDGYDLNFSATCPHCHTRQVAFTFLGEHVFRTPGVGHIVALAACNKCDRCVMASFGGLRPTKELLTGSPLGLCPSPTPDIPPHTPAGVEQRYKEALKNMGSESYESAVMMLRKTLQLALGRVGSLQRTEARRPDSRRCRSGGDFQRASRFG